MVSKTLSNFELNIQSKFDFKNNERPKFNEFTRSEVIIQILGLKGDNWMLQNQKEFKKQLPPIRFLQTKTMMKVFRRSLTRVYHSNRGFKLRTVLGVRWTFWREIQIDFGKLRIAYNVPFSPKSLSRYYFLYLWSKIC